MKGLKGIIVLKTSGYNSFKMNFFLNWCYKVEKIV